MIPEGTTTPSRRRLTAVVAIGLAAVLAPANKSLAAELETWAAFSLSGGTEDYGRAALMGLQLAVNEYNAKGGYQGQPIQVVVYDETKPQKGVENVTRLIATKCLASSAR